jgi:hypothetical protein
VSGETKQTGTLRVKTGLAEMLKGGVIMDVVNAEQADGRGRRGSGRDVARAGPCRYPSSQAAWRGWLTRP